MVGRRNNISVRLLPWWLTLPRELTMETVARGRTLGVPATLIQATGTRSAVDFSLVSYPITCARDAQGREVVTNWGDMLQRGAVGPY